MKVVKVNNERCIGCGACFSIAPDVFECGDDGYSKVKDDYNVNSSMLEEAKDSCPTGAIEVEEKED